MKKTSQVPSQSPVSPRVLDRDALAKVIGGVIVSPRDPASGLPTGK